MELHKSQPKAHFFVPLGNESWFRSCGIQNITELDWWEEVDFSLSLNQEETGETAISARISCLPAQHNSGRSLFDTNKTLWASWAVKSPCQPLNSSTSVASVFFGGDTGYRSVPTLADQSDDWGEAYKDLPVCPAFSQIGKLHGPFSLGLLPIGAYEPRALMAPMHGNPRDAVEIFRDTGCKRALAMHWGTWVMGDEHIGEPPKKLAEALTARGLPERGIFDVCNAGESVLIPI
jgi:L-ascorbate metabolism protein UlaG (beta-lactamase superfamily)